MWCPVGFLVSVVKFPVEFQTTVYYLGIVKHLCRRFELTNCPKTNKTRPFMCVQNGILHGEIKDSQNLDWVVTLENPVFGLNPISRKVFVLRNILYFSPLKRLCWNGRRVSSWLPNFTEVCPPTFVISGSRVRRRKTVARDRDLSTRLYSSYSSLAFRT